MIWILIIYAVIVSAFIFTDLYFYFSERLSHFHIGRWDNDTQWKKAVEKVCRKWAVKTPSVRLRDDCRYLLLDIIQKKYSKKMVQSWQKAGCLLGLEENPNEENKRSIDSAVSDLISSEGQWKIKVDKIDYAMLAYTILKNSNDPAHIRKAMDDMLECILSNLCDDGMVSYSAGKNSKRRYVDTLGFVCPFLALYGKIYDRNEYIDMAMQQVINFRSRGMISGLPVHCFETETATPIGICGWGRGAGWYALGVIDMYPSLPKEQQEDAAKWIKELAEECKSFEREDGGFSSILQTSSRYDSSATVMLGYFYERAAQIFDSSDYHNIACRCLKKLKRVTKISGVIDECQGDTKDIGVFSQHYTYMPFVQGMTLRLANIIQGD